jgi:sigma-B regulation protein RsbU (phosphoserine phosphatase)
MPQATFLGAFEDTQFEAQSIVLQPGDRVIFYTDGLFESQRRPDEEFGMERVHAYLQAQHKRDIQPLLDGLVDALMDFMAGATVEDDITIVGLDVLG